MFRPIARTDNSLLGIWWWTIDRWTLGFVLLLVLIGVMMSFSASPSIADQLHVGSYYFVKRHLMYAIMAILILLTVSLLSPLAIRRIGLLLFICSLGFSIMTIFVGEEVKGATRWLSLGGISFQPSEFLKPTFAVLSAWMFAEKRLNPEVPGAAISFGLYLLVIGILFAQPDLGMVVLISMVWLTQFFLAGLSIFWIMVASIAGVLGLVASYFTLPHVTRRIDQFFDPGSCNRFTDSYQITQSLESFMRGGILGQGPGEGVIKKHLPDAHSDFVFAVMAEELGLVICIVLICIFIVIAIRSFARVVNENNFFIILAVSGLITEFVLQAMINMASTINLIPTKGMTLPFISYGGSSMLALALSVGMVLALTRRRVAGGVRW